MNRIDYDQDLVEIRNKLIIFKETELKRIIDILNTKIKKTAELKEIVNKEGC